MRHFKSAGHAQRFLSAFEPIRGHFRLRRHKRPAAEYHAARREQFGSWNEVTGAHMGA
jgi:putative transposase